MAFKAEFDGLSTNFSSLDMISRYQNMLMPKLVHIFLFTTNGIEHRTLLAPWYERKQRSSCDLIDQEPTKKIGRIS